MINFDIKYLREGIKNKDQEYEINYINDSINEQCWIYAVRSRIYQITSNLIINVNFKLV